MSINQHAPFRMGHIVDVNVDNDLLSFEPPTTEKAELTRIIHTNIDSGLALQLQPVLNYDQIKVYSNKGYYKPDDFITSEPFNVNTAISTTSREQSVFAFLDYLYDERHGSPDGLIYDTTANNWLGEMSADQKTKVYKTLDISDIKFETKFTNEAAKALTGEFEISSTEPDFRFEISKAMVGSGNTFMSSARNSLLYDKNDTHILALTGDIEEGYHYELDDSGNPIESTSYKSALAKLFFSSDADQKYSVETYSDTLQDPVIHSFVSRIAPMLLGFHNQLATLPDDTSIDYLNSEDDTWANADVIVQFAEFHLRRLMTYGDWDAFDGATLNAKSEFTDDSNFDADDFETLKTMFDLGQIKSIYDDVLAHHKKTIDDTPDKVSVREKLIDFIDQYNTVYAGTKYVDVTNLDSELPIPDNSDLIAAANALREQISVANQDPTFTGVSHTAVKLNNVNIVQPVRFTHNFSSQLWDIIISRA